MSIIFETLEKLKNDTRQKGTGQRKAGKNKNVISFDKIVSSLPRLLVAGGLVIAFCVATYYVIGDLTNNAPVNGNEIALSETITESSEEVHRNENSPPNHISTVEQSEIEPTEGMESLKNTPELTRERISASEEVPPAQETADAAYLPPRHRANNKSEPGNQDVRKNASESTRTSAPAPEGVPPGLETGSTDYSSPEHQGNNNLPFQQEMEKQAAQYSRPATTHKAAMYKQDLEPDLKFQEDSEPQNLLPDNEAVKQKILGEISSAPVFKAPRRAVRTDNVPKPLYYELPGPAETVAIHETESNHNSAVRQSGASTFSDSRYYSQTPFETSGNETTDKVKQEKVRLAAVKKNARICRLVSEIKQSLLSANDSRTESLLKELISYKGQDDDYVMKLRAFWHLKQGKHESAKSLLDLLLQKDENDLEAGINMAVLDIKTNRLEQAQERLERLRRVYSDNTQIPSLLKKIRTQ